MAKVTAIYTGPALLDPLKSYFARRFPEHTLVNLLDDSIVAELIQAGTMTNAVLRKLSAYCREAQDSGSDIILQTCSSVGISVPMITPFLDIPLLRIDRPMAHSAVGRYKKIGVLATLSSTLEPTLALVQEEAESAGLKIDTFEGLARGAFEALCSGDGDAHDRLILERAESLAGKCDVLLLAQGSMARMQKTLAGHTGLPVLSSPESGVDALAPYLEACQ